jgi:hypothetical protein
MRSVIRNILKRAIGLSDLEQRLDRIEKSLAGLAPLLSVAEHDRAGPSDVGRLPSDTKDLLASNGIFIVGHARSGTSVLQMALNTCADIFMLGEANLHLHHAKQGFASWYRTMHAEFGTPPSKETYCADIAGPYADAWGVLRALRSRYRLVGEKVAFRGFSLGYDFEGSFAFLTRYFPGSYFLCTLRDPKNVLSSNQMMFSPKSIDDYILSYLECLYHEINIYRCLERVIFVVYEDIRASTFDVIGKWLNCDLSDPISFYDEEFQMSPRQQPVGADSELLALAQAYYERLKALIDPATLSVKSKLELHLMQIDLAHDIVDVRGALKAKTEQQHLVQNACIAPTV